MDARVGPLGPVLVPFVDGGRKESCAKVQSIALTKWFEKPFNCMDLNHTVPLELESQKEHLSVEKQPRWNEVCLENGLQLLLENEVLWHYSRRSILTSLLSNDLKLVRDGSEKCFYHSCEGSSQSPIDESINWSESWQFVSAYINNVATQLTCLR